jgi:hypothetical protein
MSRLKLLTHLRPLKLAVGGRFLDASHNPEQEKSRFESIALRKISKSDQQKLPEPLGAHRR